MTSQVTLRCPGCGSTVPMPAASCGQCGWNFREGRRRAPPVAEPEAGARAKIWLAAAAALALIVVAALLLSGDPAPPPAAAPPAQADGLLQDLPAISGANPLLKPAATIGTAQDAAERHEERVDQLQDLHQLLSEEGAVPD
ncbi:MAG: hypothetical protein LBU12_09470 [Deltaproteobacteria bacterium]|jgi:hypothetical protein|nr:hypothetical protein [Deltaproteobacteria bacterium]